MFREPTEKSDLPRITGAATAGTDSCSEDFGASARQDDLLACAVSMLNEKPAQIFAVAATHRWLPAPSSRLSTAFVMVAVWRGGTSCRIACPVGLVE